MTLLVCAQTYLVRVLKATRRWTALLLTVVQFGVYLQSVPTTLWPWLGDLEWPSWGSIVFHKHTVLRLSIWQGGELLYFQLLFCQSWPPCNLHLVTPNNNGVGGGALSRWQGGELLYSWLHFRMNYVYSKEIFWNQV